MVGKDQSIGAAILIVCLAIALIYVATLFFPQWLEIFGVTAQTEVKFWVIAVPVFIAVIGIMAIGMWIGWTMATTPPPKPIEEITSELERTKEEEKRPEETVEESPKEPEEPKKPRKKTEK